MAIVASDIITRFSVTSGAAGDATAGTAAGSMGKYVSTTAWADGAILFDDVSGAENAASEAEYRCIFVLNNHATLTLQNAVVYLSAEVAGGASVALAVDNIAASAKGSASAQAAQIANEDTAPTGVGAFSSPTTAATGLALGNLAPGQVRGVWIRRTTANTVAVDADGFTLGIAGDTAA
jgi:hypothetical protein